jgi:hypothetical protein
MRTYDFVLLGGVRIDLPDSFARWSHSGQDNRQLDWKRDEGNQVLVFRLRPKIAIAFNPRTNHPHFTIFDARR